MKKTLADCFFIVIGAILFGCGLELFLIPKELIDGGVVGIAMMVAHLTDKPIGFFLILFNLPFLLIGWRRIGVRFTIYTLAGLILSSFLTYQLHHYPAATDDLLLSVIFGGMLVGAGVGLIIRTGGSLDGSEIVAIVLNRKMSFSVGEIVLFINVFIFMIAAFVFGAENAMYSVLAYVVASRTIDVVVEGLDQTREAKIISDFSEEIAAKIQSDLDKNVTFMLGKGGYTGEDKQIIYSVINRLEEKRLKNIVSEIDPEAFIAISHIHDIQGGRFGSKGH